MAHTRSENVAGVHSTFLEMWGNQERRLKDFKGKAGSWCGMVVRNITLVKKLPNCAGR